MTFKTTVLSALALLATALMAGPASAAQPAGTVDLTKVKAKGVVKDVILDAPPKVAGIAKTGRAAYTDSAGRSFTIDTTVPGADLNAFGAVLNSTYHGAEIADVIVHVVTLAEIATICGSSQALACYLPTDPARNGKGQIWVANDDTDWKHSLVHEYGHHTDNQLLNIAHLNDFGIGRGCGIDGDASREWFFVRVLGEKLSDTFACSSPSWENLLPELYAEDFVVLNGIIGWQLSTAGPPASSALKAMKRDIDIGLKLSTKKLTRTIRHARTYTKTVTTPNISFLYVYVSGAKGRDFDVWVYPHGGRKLYAKSRTRGRVESLFTAVDPGTWDIKISARKKTGNAKIRIELL
ncbi:MAG: hypothetical protein JHD02_10665 [Thermoleophilaceae bacterium]|nr:hypothetical protein [Thermoleophilaceae bacterium]